MSSEQNKKALNLLFQNPLEPVFAARDDGKSILDVPDSFYTENYTEVKEDIQNRFGAEVDVKIPIRELKQKPNLEFANALRKRQQFSLFYQPHRRIAGQLIQLLIEPPTEEDFISLAAFVKDRVNAFLFQYAFSVAVQHRKDTANFQVPVISEQFPQNFVEPSVFQDARAEGKLVTDPGSRRRIEIPPNFTASDREEEQRLSYFREDIGVNSHHWHWHLVYPGSGPEEVVRKDRRGELFYYMHHQLMARYNVERFCNNLAKLQPLNNIREPIIEGYFPKILSSLNNRTYPGRIANTKLKDIDRDGRVMELADIERWINRIVQAIDQGYVTDTRGTNIPLDEIKGIDLLGDLMECSDLSVNPGFYGLEPVFAARDDGKSILDVPDSFYTENYTEVKEDIQNRFGAEVDVKIPIRELKQKPNLEFANALRKRQQFSLFYQPHRRIAGQLIQLLIEPPTEEDFISLAAFVKDRVNAFLFQYAFSVAVQHRKDTANFQVPVISEQFPQNFVEPSVFQDARAEGKLVTDPGSRRRIEIPPNFTASDREEEQRLSYFREDIGVNSHHWHWHLVYPGSGPEEVVRKDRRGELFYYMHHQLMARYNVERFCNNLAKLQPLNNIREPIIEGYFPKILSSLNNRTYPGRIANTKLKDIDRDGRVMELADIERWINRIVQAIDQGYVTDTRGTNIPLDEIKGIDLLGDLMECSDLSVNPGFYGDLHNQGHNCISFSHDPDNRFLEDFGVMGDVTTAMRDPIFYRWHGYLDTLFNRFKEKLPVYSEPELGYNGVSVTRADVRIISSSKNIINTLLTYWEKSDVDLAAGLDFGPGGSVYALFRHLQHSPFEYLIEVNNETGTVKRGTCRIFLCPITDERGTPLTLNEQRQLSIELDKFTVNLMPGVNKITQSYDNSSVTIPYERSFRRLDKAHLPSDPSKLAEFRFCGCGWPAHMLLPKGKPEGMQFELFVMISNYDDDAVLQRNDAPDVCGDAASFCGLKDKLYPDKRAMGYPFDRRLPADTLTALTDHFSNMKKTPVQIINRNEVVERKRT
ncbi:PREDICTED: phenoloxidase 2-like [Rhagoletis zephyria]|uniref:phenoloxidase 2-like n=1 Tax=Rhagoletis zephyria TaxID=28612 RepID=UPI0008116778|nr:PREDICTED: phenoloxidase 2-like [Rhagoletis zephyria]